MKIKHLILFVAAAALAVTACENEVPVDPAVTVTTQEIPAITDEGGSITVTFTSTLDWTATKDANWLSIKPTEGVAGEACTITVTAQPNTTYDARTGKVTITCGTETKASQTITVTQKQKGALVLTQNSYTVGDEGETITVQVKANSDITAKVDGQAASWIIPLDTKGLVDSEFQFEIKPNENYDERSGFITFSNEAGSEKVTITQKEKGALLLTQSTYEVDSKGETITVKVKANANVSWQVDAEAEGWIIPLRTKSLTESEYQFQIAANQTYDARSGSITFSNEYGTEKVTVNQKQLDAIVITDNQISVAYTGGAVYVTTKSNVDVSYSVAQNAAAWIVPFDTKGLSENSFGFDVAPNENHEERVGVITFSGSGISQDVTITQEAAPEEPPVNQVINIANASALVQFAQDYNNNVYAGNDELEVALTADIAFTSATSEAFNATGGIGTKDGEVSNYFHGVFDGGNHTISGLTATAPLFAYIGSEGTVKNFTIANDCSFTFTHPADADAYFGAVAGYHKGAIENVTVNADVALAGTTSALEVNTMLGGIVGRATTGTVSNCSYTGNITAPGEFGSTAKLIIGGLVGYFSNTGSVSGSSFAGTICNVAKVSSTSKDPYLITGGIVGYNAAGTISDCETSDNPVIEGSYAGSLGTIVVKTELAYSVGTGGIVGENLGTVTGCVNKAQILSTIFKIDNSDASARYLRVGGIAGRNLGEGVITNCNNEAAVVTRSNPRLHSIGGIVGWNGEGTTVSGCTNSAALSIGTAGTGSYSARLPYFGGVIGENYSSNISDVHNTAELLISRTENSTGVDARMGGVIGCNYAPIDGGANRSITNSGKIYYNCNISSQAIGYSVGGIVGYTEASVKGALNSGYVLFNWNSDANVLSLAHVGGIVGRLKGVEGAQTYEISNCVNDGLHGGDNPGEVNVAVKKGAAGHTENFAGGILGYTNAPVSISHCENSGYIHGGNTNKVNGKTFYVGGIVAYISGASSISNCTNFGKLLNDQFNNTITKVGATFEGGIAGFALGSSEARISITDVVDAGAGFGPRRGYCGRVAGYAEYVDISNAECHGSFVGGSGYFIGGVAGWLVNGVVKDSYYDGTTIQTSQLQGAGGIVAVLDAGSEIENCTSKVTTIDMNGAAVTAVGAIAGKSVEGSTISNCHYKSGSLAICSDSNFTDGGGNAADAE